MGNIDWKVTVWLNCEIRVGKDENERIKKSVLSFAQDHSPEEWLTKNYKLRHPINIKKWPKWILYCYFMLKPQPNVDVIDIAPQQTTDLGERWLKLVGKHFKVYGMPWRLRQSAPMYALMITGGKDEVEALKDGISTPIRQIKIEPEVQKRIAAELLNAEKQLKKYYAAMRIADDRQALEALEFAVYIQHELIFDIGEVLGFIPSKIF